MLPDTEAGDFFRIENSVIHAIKSGVMTVKMTNLRTRDKSRPQIQHPINLFPYDPNDNIFLQFGNIVTQRTGFLDDDTSESLDFQLLVAAGIQVMLYQASSSANPIIADIQIDVGESGETAQIVPMIKTTLQTGEFELTLAVDIWGRYKSERDRLYQQVLDFFNGSGQIIYLDSGQAVNLLLGDARYLDSGIFAGQGVWRMNVEVVANFDRLETKEVVSISDIEVDQSLDSSP